MKKIICALMVLELLVAGVAMGCAASAKGETIEDVYAITTVVVELNHRNDTVTCQDFNGNLWVFYGVEDWLVGDVATLIMWNAETDTIYDDEIVHAYYSGWFTPEQAAQWFNH